MITARNIYDFLDRLAGFDQMPAYDNSGFLIGNIDRKVRTALVCLDCTADVIEQARKIGAQLIISHHPVIFDPIKKLTPDDVVWKAVSADVAVLSLHIPIDEIQNGANLWLCEKLGLEPLEPFLLVRASDGSSRCSGWVGKLPAAREADDFVQDLAKQFDCGMRYNDGGRPIETVVVCGGGGRSFTSQFLESGHDCYVSSEFHHNHYLDAKAAGVTLVDGTHFATEIHIPQTLAQKLAEEFPDTDFFLASEQNPVITI